MMTKKENGKRRSGRKSRQSAVNVFVRVSQTIDKKDNRIINGI
jgi:hypothetical protein